MDDRFRVRQVRVQADRAVASAKHAITDYAEVFTALAAEISETPIEEIRPKIEAARKLCAGAQQALDALCGLAETAGAIKA